jgi:hypothetical protein
MRVEFFEPVLEQNIVKEICQWSKEALETKSSFFGGMPACPYARQAWADQKVSIMFKYEPSFQVLYTSISQFDDNFELNIIVDMNYEKNPEDFHDYLHSLNICISDGMFIDRDIWLMGFHPDDEPNDFVAEPSEGFEPYVDQEYAMIFVQRLSKLQESADKLAKKGYYKSYEADYNAKELFEHRHQLYRRLKDGDET